jgi:hypothetical protein
LVKGLKHDYKLEINSCQQNKQLNFNMQTLSIEKFKPDESVKMFIPTKLYGQIPIDVFHWLQNQMTEIMVGLNHKKL